MYEKVCKKWRRRPFPAIPETPVGVVKMRPPPPTTKARVNGAGGQPSFSHHSTDVTETATETAFVLTLQMSLTSLSPLSLRWRVSALKYASTISRFRSIGAQASTETLSQVPSEFNYVPYLTDFSTSTKDSLISRIPGLFWLLFCGGSPTCVFLALGGVHYPSRS